MKAKPFGPERSLELDRHERLLKFLEETIAYFLSKKEFADKAEILFSSSQERDS